MTFTVELGGIPIQVECRHGENRTFLQDYLTDRPAEITVSPGEEDLREIRIRAEKKAEKQGFRNLRITDRYLENNALHALIAGALLSRNVLLFHGSALCMEGEAVIFAAPSGTGKSTQARLWREAFGERVWMINDDKPLISLAEEPVRVYGTPWDGKHGLSRNASAPLKAILFLTRSSENRLLPMSRPEAFRALAGQSYLPGDLAAAGQSLSLQTKLLEKAAFYRFFCNTSREAALTAARGVFAP